MALFQDGYHLATPPGAAPASLEEGQLLLLEKGHCLQRHALRAYPDRQLHRDESFAATSLTTLVSMVAEGLGITLLPDLAIAAGVARGQRIALTPLPDACPREVVLVWRKTSPRIAVFRRIGALLQ